MHESKLNLDRRHRKNNSYILHTAVCKLQNFYLSPQNFLFEQRESLKRCTPLAKSPCLHFLFLAWSPWYESVNSELLAAPAGARSLSGTPLYSGTVRSENTGSWLHRDRLARNHKRYGRGKENNCQKELLIPGVWVICWIIFDREEPLCKIKKKEMELL